MKEHLYKLVPYWLKVVFVNIKAFSNFKKRYSKDYFKYLEEYNKLWYSDRSIFLAYQKQQLTELLLECYRYSEYYQEIFSNNNISENDIFSEPYKVIRRIPLLSKIKRKILFSKIINNNPKRKIIEVGYTSGTTGTPTKNFLDKESIARSFALWSRFHHYLGVKENVKKVRFSGRIIINPKSKTPPFWVYNFIEKQLFMSMYHLTEENLKDYVFKLNKFKPVFMDGYPSAYYTLAKYINKNKIELHFKPKFIATTAETLYDFYRIEIERAFRCKVYNQYASSEGSPFITECVEGKLHINEDSGYFEFLDKNNFPAKSGEVANIVVTSFRNWKTPLIRYQIEDSVILNKIEKDCLCGCKMKYVDKICGREDDLLWTKEKGYIAGMNKAYVNIDGILKSQIIQKTPVEFIVKNIVDIYYTDEMNKKFIRNLKDRVGSNTVIKIEIVSNIPLGPNGKFNAVKRLFNIDMFE